MTLSPRVRDLFWMSVGATIFLAVGLIVMHFRHEPIPGTDQGAGSNPRKLRATEVVTGI